MKKGFVMSLCLLALGTTAWSCIDDKYDLSDIDSTVQVKVNDLVIPINIDKIDMGSIIKLDEDGIVQIVNNEYAVVKDGSINSSEVKIDPIVINSINITPTVDIINTVPASGVSVDLPLPSTATSYSYSSNAISSKVIELDKAYASFALDIKFSISPNPGGKITLNNVKITLPKGLIINNQNYDAATGIYSAPTIDVVSGVANLHIPVEGVDFSFHPSAFDTTSRLINFVGELKISDGVIRCNNSTIGDKVEFKVEYKFSDINVKSIDGVIEYPIEGMSITNVDINNLPDVLSQPGTDLRLVNPVFYLNVTNPLNSVNLYAQTGFVVTAYRDNALPQVYAMNDPVIVGNTNSDGIYNYYLSPLEIPSSQLDPAFPSPIHYTYATLGDILSGDGLPKSLEVALDNPKVPRQHVKNLLIGHNYGEVKGKYKFVAPLQFAGGSNVIYTDKMDGWYSEDMEYLTIQTLEVHATVSSDVPLQLNFTGYPIDENGNRINNVSIVGAEINANADNQEIVIRITGEITKLDGIQFSATATAAPNGAALSPDMKIHLSDVRPCVSGYYQKEL